MEKQTYLTEPFPNIAIQTNQQLGLQSFSNKFRRFPTHSQSGSTMHKFHNRVTRPHPPTSSQFPSEDYYQNKKVKPGIHLYKTILEIEERRWENTYNGPELSLNIPETFAYYDNTYYLLTCNKQNRKLQIQKNMNYMHYLQTFRDFTDVGVIQPSGVMLNGNGTVLDRTVVMSNDIAVKSFPKNQSQAICRYVMPYRRYPNKLRLFFFPKNTRTIRKNYAQKIVNKNPMDQQLFKKKYKLEHQFFVMSGKEDLCYVNTVNGGALETCEKMAHSLTEYLEKAKGVKIFEMVIDFVVDQNKQPWFSQLRSVRSKNLTKIWDVGTSEQIEQMAHQKNNQLICPLCDVAFRRNEMQRLVTNKLVYELLAHLQLRGADMKSMTFCKLRNKYDGFTNVCSLCYDLIVAQHKLINVEQQFSKIMNITSNEVQRVPMHKKNANLINPEINSKLSLSTNNNSGHSQQVELSPNLNNCLTIKKQFLQWRLMICIHRVKGMKNINYTSEDSMVRVIQSQEIQMDIKNGRLLDRFDKSLVNGDVRLSGIHQTRFKSSLVSDSGRRVHYEDKQYLLDKLDKATTKENSLWKESRVTGVTGVTTTGLSREKLAYPSVNANQTLQNYALVDDSANSSISVERVKIYIFYTDSEDISKFLEDAKLKFSMRYCNQKFKGETSTLQVFHNKMTCQRHSSEVYLFDEQYKYCNVEVTTGLICDGEVGSLNSHAELEYSENDSVYFPLKNAFNSCRPLPQEWMEVFTDGKVPHDINLTQKMAVEQVGLSKRIINKSKLEVSLKNSRDKDSISR